MILAHKSPAKKLNKKIISMADKKNYGMSKKININLCLLIVNIKYNSYYMLKWNIKKLSINLNLIIIYLNLPLLPHPNPKMISLSFKNNLNKKNKKIIC
jgi:hypothetical protein